MLAGGDVGLSTFFFLFKQRCRGKVLQALGCVLPCLRALFGAFFHPEFPPGGKLSHNAGRGETRAAILPAFDWLYLDPTQNQNL